MNRRVAPGHHRLRTALAPTLERRVPKAIVTGGAGFIGSTLAHRLLADGWDVTVVDRLSGYYDVAVKQEHLDGLRTEGADVVVADLLTADLDAVMEGADVVFHQAGQPGVRASWADGFASYTTDNVLATQVLLEAANRTGVTRFVYASSSSVYGDNEDFPFVERSLPAPRSPYGVTKLAGEHLVNLYAANFGLPAVSLRYFTVYGPRQRPDMATHRLIECALTGRAFRLHGDGMQERDFTFVDDIVRANVLAAGADVAPGTVCNLGGGSVVSMRDLIGIVEDATGRPVAIDQVGDQAGDVRRTGADTSAARTLLGWRAEVGLEEGVAAQVAWHRARMPAGA